MDIFAHGLAAAAAAAAVQPKSRWRIRPWWALLFGVLPDLVTFTVPACLRIWWWLSGASPTLLPQPNGPRPFEWVWGVYNCLHSGLVFAVFFAALWLVMRRPVLEALGWLLHILLDSFTHQGIFATQFLWPLSSAHFDGLRWETPWLLGATYGVLLVAYVLLWRRRVSTRARAAVESRQG